MSSLSGVIAVPKSLNSKIGRVAATYVSQESCPQSCPFMGSGCYAETDMTGIHTGRLNRQSKSGKLTKTMADVKRAMGMGYAAAIMVSEHGGSDGKATLRDGLRVVPCPQQTGRAADCMSCGLCLDAGRLRQANIVIEFATHGSQGKRAGDALKLVQIGGTGR